MRALTDTLIVRPDDRVAITTAGIILPDHVRTMRETGTVLAVGPGRLTDEGPEPGDRVVYRKLGGTDFTRGAEKLRTLPVDDVLCILI